MKRFFFVARMTEMHRQLHSDLISILGEQLLHDRRDLPVQQTTFTSSQIVVQIALVELVGKAVAREQVSVDLLFALFAHQAMAFLELLG